MSNFQQMAKHPLTGEMQLADWLDLGQRFYVVQFSDGQRFCETEIESIGGESSQGETAVEDWDGPEEPR